MKWIVLISLCLLTCIYLYFFPMKICLAGGHMTHARYKYSKMCHWIIEFKNYNYTQPVPLWYNHSQTCVTHLLWHHGCHDIHVVAGYHGKNPQMPGTLLERTAILKMQGNLEFKHLLMQILFNADLHWDIYMWLT